MRNRTATLLLVLVAIAIAFTTQVALAATLDDFLKALQLSKVDQVVLNYSKCIDVEAGASGRKVCVSIGSADLYKSEGELAPIFVKASNLSWTEGIFLINESYVDPETFAEKHLLGFVHLLWIVRDLYDQSFVFWIANKTLALYNVAATGNETWLTLVHTFMDEAEYRQSLAYPFDLIIRTYIDHVGLVHIQVRLVRVDTGEVLLEKDLILTRASGYSVKTEVKDWVLPLLIPYKLEQGKGYIRLHAWLVVFVPYSVEEREISYETKRAEILVDTSYVEAEGESNKVKCVYCWCWLTGVTTRATVRNIIDFTILNTTTANITAEVSFEVCKYHKQECTEGRCSVSFHWGCQDKFKLVFLPYNTSYVWTPKCWGSCISDDGARKISFLAPLLNFTMFRLDKPIRILVNTTVMLNETSLSLDVNYIWPDGGVTYCGCKTFDISGFKVDVKKNISLVLEVKPALPHKLMFYKVLLIGRVGSLEGIPVVLEVYQLPKFEIVDVKADKLWILPTDEDSVTLNVTVKNVGGSAGDAEICVYNPAGDKVCKTVSLGVDEVDYVLFTLSGKWVSGGSEGNYTLEIKVKNLATGEVDDTASITLHVYWPLFVIKDVVYNGTSIYESRKITGVWGGGKVRLNIYVCNVRTSGYIRIAVYRGGEKLAESDRFFLGHSTCTWESIEFTVHDIYVVETYEVEAIDVTEGNVVDDVFMLDVLPGPPLFRHYQSPRLNESVEKPGHNVTLFVWPQNIGKSRWYYRVKTVYYTRCGTYVLGEWKFLIGGLGGYYEYRALNITLPRPCDYPGVVGNLSVYLISEADGKVHDVRNVTLAVYWPVFRIADKPGRIVALNGTKVRICITIENKGADGYVEYRLLLGGSLVNKTLVHVDAFSNKTACLEVKTPTQVGNYTLYIVLYDPYEQTIDDNANITLVVKLCPLFRIVKVVPNPVKVAPGESFIVTACVRNVGAEGKVKLVLVDHRGSIQDESTWIHLLTNETKCVDLVGKAPSEQGLKLDYKVLAVKVLDGETYVDDTVVLKVRTYVYVPRIEVVKAEYPSRVDPATWFSIKLTIRNSGNGTGVVTPTIDPPANTTCKLVQGGGRIDPGYTMDIVWNCSSPAGPGHYVYTVALFENITMQTVKLHLVVNVAPRPTLELKPEHIAFLAALLVIVGAALAYRKRREAK